MSQYLWVLTSIAINDVETSTGKRLRRRLLDGEITASELAGLLVAEDVLYSDSMVEAIDDEEGRFVREDRRS
jgi:hypothetical protein